MLYVKLGETKACAYLPDGKQYKIQDRLLTAYLTFPDGSIGVPSESERVELSEGGAWVTEVEKDLFERAVTLPQKKQEKPKE